MFDRSGEVNNCRPMDIAFLYDLLSDVQFARFMKLIEGHSFSENSAMLDFGCGTGRCTLKVSSMNPSMRVVGLDHDPTMIMLAEAKMRLARSTELVEFHCGSLDYQSERKFDAIVSANALHWIKDASDFATRARDWLVPGGTLLFECAAPKTLTTIVNLVAVLPGLVRNRRIVGHTLRAARSKVYLRSAVTWRKLLERANYSDIICVASQDPIQFQVEAELVQYVIAAVTGSEAGKNLDWRSMSEIVEVVRSLWQSVGPVELTDTRIRCKAKASR